MRLRELAEMLLQVSGSCPDEVRLSGKLASAFVLIDFIETCAD